MSANLLQFPKRTHAAAPVKAHTRKQVPPEIPLPESDGWVDFNKYLIANQEHTLVINICGDDEENGIYEGDLLVVDCSVKPNKGDLIIYNEDGQLVTRCFVSSHLKLATDEHEATEAARVFGVVIHHIHTLRRIEQSKQKGGRK
jgi:SOS-response transcriptional repressor LexA